MRKLFIHIPKNAGSAVKKALRPLIYDARDVIDAKYKRELVKVFPGTTGMNKPNYTHCRWRDVSANAKQNLQAIAIVRNPWDRVVSRYLFREVIRTTQKGTYTQVKTFEEFLEERLVNAGKPFFWHRAVDGWYPQQVHVVDDEGNLRCHILRYEFLQEDIQKYFGKDIDLRWKNVSNGQKADNSTRVVDRRDYKEFYTEETKQIIADWYKNDIDFFGFTFEGPATKNIWNKK